jgi:hypothetical protein
VISRQARELSRCSRPNVAIDAKFELGVEGFSQRTFVEPLRDSTA